MPIRCLPEQIFWIGGSPCAGKISVSQLLASRYDLRIYQVDFELRSQMDHIDPVRHPTLFGWLAASSDQRWLKPIDELVDDAIGCYRDHFSLIVEDSVSLHEDNETPHNRATLVEGTALLPERLAAQLVLPDHAIWMTPTPAFQLEHYRRRPWVKAPGSKRCSLIALTRSRLSTTGWYATFNLRNGSPKKPSTVATP